MDVARLQRARHGAGPRRERGRPRLPHRARLPRRRPHHLPGRPPGAGGRGASARSATCPHHTSDVLRPRRAAAGRGRPRAGRPRSSNAGKKVAILAGRGALRRDATSWSSSPRRSARRSSRRCSARRPCPTTARTPPAAIGLLGTRPSQEALEECDTLLMVGTSFPYIEFLPEAGPGARRADRPRPDAHRPALPGRGRPGRRQPRARSQALLPLLERKTDRSFLETGAGGHEGVAGADGGARHPRRTSR